MKEKITQVYEIPKDVEFNATLEIMSNNVSYFTHGFFKYPCKFIPQIPRWAIQTYSMKNCLVLDPFAGSGTTLVEAVLNNRNALGVDFDKLSQLLSKTKTSPLSREQIKYLDEIKKELFNTKWRKASFKPDLHNIEHWFPEDNISQLSTLKERIDQMYSDTKDETVYNFLLVCFASIIKKCSYADDTSPKPYVSTRIKKHPLKVTEAFLKTLESYLKIIEQYTNANLGNASIISEDAREINAPKYSKKVSLAITSPPYINAFDYVRSLRLENAWLGYYGDSNIIDIKKKQVGTEIISSDVYRHGPKETGVMELNSILNKVYQKDKKRAFVIHKFFEDMGKNFIEIHELLKKGAHYVVVVGDSTIRGFNVPTHKILIEIAEQRGFKLNNLFSYIIKNRYLRIPRSGRGGLIKKDWVIDLVK